MLLSFVFGEQAPQTRDQRLQMVVQTAADHRVQLAQAGQRVIEIRPVLRQAEPCGGGFQVGPDLIQALDGVAHLFPCHGQGSRRGFRFVHAVRS